MTYRPNVGDKVRLSAQGMMSIHGIETPEEFKAQLDGSLITRSTAVPCSDAELYDIQVDGPFGKFLLTNFDLEPFR